MKGLRVCDFGPVSARRSQTLWHAVAEGVSAGGPSTLSFMRPSRPYVGIGYHRSVAEVDLAWCRRARLPVYRRRVGGSVVYLDPDQLFFQICVPARSLPPGREAALRRLLGPAVEAFRATGVDATLDAAGEITVGGAKVCGHGAAQIGDAVVVVGNLIERFDHAAAARVLALPSEARSEVERLMRRFVAATPVDSRAFRDAAVAVYAAALDLTPAPPAALSALDDTERAALAYLDLRFSTRDWRNGPAGLRPAPAARTVKVRAGAFVVNVEAAGARLVAAVVEGNVERARLAAPEWNGQATRLAARLTGMSLADAATVLAANGPIGAALAEAVSGLRLAA